MLKKLLFAAAILTLPLLCRAAEPIQIHSHNDYMQKVPFYRAYSQMVNTIEADVRLEEGSGMLLVSHDAKDMVNALDIEQMYLDPLVFLFTQNGGRPWMRSEQKLTLMIDLKTALHPTIDVLIGKLRKHPAVFDPQVNPLAVRIVISGSRPEPADYGNYPAFISFDGVIDAEYTPGQLERIGFISEYFGQYSQWKGEGDMPAADRKAIEAAVEKAHRQGKAIRFWGSPDTPTAWATFRDLGIDIINTDRPEACTEFFGR